MAIDGSDDKDGAVGVGGFGMTGLWHFKNGKGNVVMVNCVDRYDGRGDLVLGERSEVILVGVEKDAGVVMEGEEALVAAWREAYVAIKASCFEAM